MAYRITPVKEKFDPALTRGELNFINNLRSTFGKGPYDEHNLDFFPTTIRLHYKDELDDLIRKGIFELSPSQEEFDFTPEGWEAYVDLLKRQKEWEAGNRNVSFLDQKYFQVDGENKWELMKAFYRIFLLAKKSIRLQEPYPDAKFIFLLGDIGSSVLIKFLTSEKQKDKAKLIASKSALSELLVVRSNTEVKINNKIHARRIIIDEKWVWESTGSQTTKDILTFTKITDVKNQMDLFEKSWSSGSNFSGSKKREIEEMIDSAFFDETQDKSSLQAEKGGE